MYDTLRALEPLHREMQRNPCTTSRVLEHSILELPKCTETFDAVVTSPPYPGAQKYLRFSSLSLGWLGMVPSSRLSAYEDRQIGREHLRREAVQQAPGSCGIDDADEVIQTVYKTNAVRAHIGAVYLREMRRALKHLEMIMGSDGVLHMVAGPSQFLTHVFDTPAYMIQLAHEFNFTLKERIDDPIRSRRLMTRRNRHIEAIAYEALLTFERS